MNYKIYPVYLGGVDVDISTIIYRHAIGEKIKMVIGAFVLQDEDGEYILVDTGAPSAREIREKGYGLRQMADSVEYIDEIKKLGVDPEQIKLIILTHLHWDHAWNLEYFPTAQVLVQQKELEFDLNPTPNARKSYGLTKQIGGPNWLKAVLQLKVVKGDAEIRPGIRVILTPGHTPGSQTVAVDTKDGMYLLLNDLCMNMRNYTQGIPTGSVNSVSDWYDSYEKLKAMNGKIMPTHDPDVYERRVYGE